MKPCPECGEQKELKVDPLHPDESTLWETHRHGCSWSPLITPAAHKWPMRNVARTDAPVRPDAGQEKGR